MLSGRDSSAFPLPEQMRRIFHPKGSYTAYANAFLEEIRANRGSPRRSISTSENQALVLRLAPADISDDT
jgi:hypothetical protein